VKRGGGKGKKGRAALGFMFSTAWDVTLKASLHPAWVVRKKREEKKGKKKGCRRFSGLGGKSPHHRP